MVDVVSCIEEVFMQVMFDSWCVSGVDWLDCVCFCFIEVLYWCVVG